MGEGRNGWGAKWVRGETWDIPEKLVPLLFRRVYEFGGLCLVVMYSRLFIILFYKTDNCIRDVTGNDFDGTLESEIPEFSTTGFRIPESSSGIRLWHWRVAAKAYIDVGLLCFTVLYAAKSFPLNGTDSMVLLHDNISLLNQ